MRTRLNREDDFFPCGSNSPFSTPSRLPHAVNEIFNLEYAKPYSTLSTYAWCDKFGCTEASSRYRYPGEARCIRHDPEHRWQLAPRWVTDFGIITRPACKCQRRTTCAAATFCAAASGRIDSSRSSAPWATGLHASVTIPWCTFAAIDSLAVL